MADSRDPCHATSVPSSLAAALPSRGFWEWPAIVAVSGGADSVALLLALAALAPPGGAPRLIVAHAHHGLRPEAEDDLAFVVDLADRLGLRSTTTRLPVATGDGIRGEGLEARARRMRYDWLGNAAHAAGARHVLVAHTADDQAETILHRILRGTGVAGLGGMKPARRLVDGVALLRPLLGTRRADLRAFLAARGQAWREDATNRDLRLARGYLRHEILPRLESHAWPGATAALVRLGSRSAEVAAALASAAGYLLDRHASPAPEGGLMLDAAALAPLDRHLLAEVGAEVWRRKGWPCRDMTARHYLALADVIAAAARGAAASETCLPGGVRARITGEGRVLLRRP